MKAEQFFKRVVNELRPPTRIKILHRARKHDLTDSYSELSWFLGAYLSETDIQEFVK